MYISSQCFGVEHIFVFDEHFSWCMLCRQNCSLVEGHPAATHTQLSVCSCMCTFRNFQCRLSKFWTTNCSCFKTVEFKLNSNWTKDVGWQSVINSVGILIHQWLHLLVLLTVMQSWGLHCVEVGISTAHCRSKYSMPFQWFASWGVSLLFYSPNIPIFVSHQIEWLFVLSLGFHRLSIQNWKIYKN